jgi:hypothetical protein
MRQPPGVWTVTIFDNLAFGYWLLAFGQKNQQRTRRSMCFHFATLCRLGLGLGLRGPWATQGPPLGHPSVTQGSPKGRMEQVVLFATKVKNAGWGRDRRNRRHRTPSHPRKPKPGFAGTPVIAEIGKGKTLPLINTDDTDQSGKAAGEGACAPWLSSTCANLERLGMGSCKCFGILVEGQGDGTKESASICGKISLVFSGYGLASPAL